MYWQRVSIHSFEIWGRVRTLCPVQFIMLALLSRSHYCSLKQSCSILKWEAEKKEITLIVIENSSNIFHEEK